MGVGFTFIDICSNRKKALQIIPFNVWFNQCKVNTFLTALRMTFHDVLSNTTYTQSNFCFIEITD